MFCRDREVVIKNYKLQMYIVFRMRISWVVNGLLVLLMVVQAWAGEEEKKKKLQIGVKKRVDNCTVKSRKGDTLHMHYTVSV